MLLEVEDGKLYYDVKGEGPLLVLVGAPMDADAFIPATSLLQADFTVLTTDPRGINRSPLNDPEQGSTPEQRGQDLAALIEHVALGPAAVLGSSGGACSVLALAQTRPDLVTTAIPHEPPLYDVLPDAADLARQEAEMVEKYRAGDRVGAWRQFMAVAGMHLPEEMFQQFFGQTPPPQQLADERFQMLHMLGPTVHFRPDAEALRALGDRLVLGIGDQSAGTFCDRSTRALGELVGREPVLFPGGHTGFVEQPPAFVARLREVLGG